MIIRGNDQRYFVHLRTRGTILPWQYYQAGFEVNGSWTEVRLPFTDFAPSGPLLRDVPRAEGLTSVGIVAYGRNHDADISVQELGFY
ncbi:CIA30 family protein [Bacillus sp. PR5]|nr:CIA30 family protein [Bacillus sp. PR5]